MRLKLVTVAFDPDTGRFPERPLDDIGGEIVSVVEHFFKHLELPHLLLIVHYEPARVAAHDGPPDRVGPTLAAHERGLFERLRAWRNGRSEAAVVRRPALKCWASHAKSANADYLMPSQERVREADFVYLARHFSAVRLLTLAMRFRSLRRSGVFPLRQGQPRRLEVGLQAQQQAGSG